MTGPIPAHEKLRRVDTDDPDGLLESITARSIVLDRWQHRLGELLELRGQDAECRALLATLQYGARPPRHLVGPPTDLLSRLRDALSRQIDLIVQTAALDTAGVHFYRGLQGDLAAISWEEPCDPIADHDIGVFTEGFLDWAALVLFETSYTDLPLDHGRRQHELGRDRPGRVHRRPADDAITGPARRTGHLMARKVVHWWAALNPGLDPTRIRLTVAGLAARLNLHDGGLSMAEKDLLVTALTPNDPAMARALREYLTDPAGPLEPLLTAAGLVRTGDSNSREPV